MRYRVNAVFSRCENVPEDRNTRDHLAWTVGNRDPMHEVGIYCNTTVYIYIKVTFYNLPLNRPKSKGLPCMHNRYQGSHARDVLVDGIMLSINECLAGTLILDVMAASLFCAADSSALATSRARRLGSTSQ